MRIARRGGLFARHLVHEARPIFDPEHILDLIKLTYTAPDSYEGIRGDVLGCAPLLDVTESEFLQNPDGMSSTASYLIRTHLYACAFERGAQSFAMTHILQMLNEHRAGTILAKLRSHRDFSAFIDARALLEELTRTNCRRIERSLEAFIVNASDNNELAMILGLRLLARGRPFTYDVLRDLEFWP
jgi:hypothetical protein